MEQLLNSFGIKWEILIWQVINFGVLFFVLSRFLYKPIKRLMQERENKIAESLKKAEELDEKSKKFEEELRQKMSEQRKEIEEMHQKAMSQQEMLRKDLKAKAEEEVQKIISEAKDMAAAEKEQILSSLEAEVKQLAVSLASKVLEREIDEEKEKELLENALGVLKKEK